MVNILDNKKVFSTGVLVFFGVLFLIGFLSFAFYSSFKNSQSQGTQKNYTVWGTIESERIDSVLNTFDLLLPEGISLTYTYIPEQTFTNEFINARAEGGGPHFILVPHTFLYEHEEKLLFASYTVFPRIQFESTFIPRTHIFLEPEGIRAIPFVVDPFVLFSNANLERKQGIRYTPKTWAQVGQLSEVVVREGTKINYALIPFGAYENYSYTKEILLSLLLQLNSSTFSEIFKSVGGIFPDEFTQTVLSFARYALPNSTTYTWNVSLPQADEYFAQDKLLYYPGYYNDYSTLLAKNPYIPISVHQLPVYKSKNEEHIGRLFSLALTKRFQENGGSDYQTGVQVLSSIAQILSTYTTPPLVPGELTTDYEARKKENIRNIKNILKLPLATISYTASPEDGQSWQSVVEASKHSYFLKETDTNANTQIINQFIREVVSDRTLEKDGLVSLFSSLNIKK
ncbi:MAG: hypothetical protein QM526_02525 [Alphaproteobacteria bacterium]|nr:hypothetical protein [Alphaproteobacteria bacterium]